jgi:hypothetical protein
VSLVANKNIPVEADPNTTPPGPGGPGGTNPAVSTPTTPAMPAGPATPAGPGGMSGTGATGASGPSAVTDVNQLNRNRYLSVTGQCRHLPLGVVVIVDQAHIHDFLASLADSPLRVQITQVLLQHARGISPPAPPSTDMGPMGPMGPLGTGGKGEPRGERPPFRPPMGPGGPMGGSGQPGVGEAEDPNLVELTVYGIAALFERFSTKKPEAGKP